MEKYREDIKTFAMELDLDLADLADLFIEYLSEIKNYGNQLMISLLEEDYKKLQQDTHAIKGISGNMCILDVFTEADEFDKQLKSKITIDANTHVIRLQLLIEDSAFRIKKVFSQEGISLE